MKRQQTAPSPEVPKRPVLRRSTAWYKLRVFAEVNACSKPAAFEEMLRREGLHSSHLSAWRRQRGEHALAGWRPNWRDRKAKPQEPAG